MNWFKDLFELYLKASLHVSISVWSLYKITFFYLNSPQNYCLDWLVFSSSIVAYNLIKYTPVFIQNKKNISASILILTFFSFLSGLFCFFYIDLLTQIFFLFSFIIVLFYSNPTFFTILNLRNYKSLKIFIVSLVWTIVTYFSLISQMNLVYDLSYITLAIQRFVFVFVLTIPFDIRDINVDMIELKTIPQILGIRRSKLLGILLLIFNTSIFYFISEISSIFILTEVFINLILGFLLIISDPRKPLNFTRFWVEGVPIIWLIIVYIFIQI